MPSSRDLPNPEIKPACLVSPALAGATWEAHVPPQIKLNKKINKISYKQGYPIQQREYSLHFIIIINEIQPLKIVKHYVIYLFYVVYLKLL